MKRFLFTALVAMMAVSCYDDTDLREQIAANRQSMIDLKEYFDGQSEVVLPKLKIENGQLKVSYDGGTDWENVGEVSSSSEECLVASVALEDDVLILVLSDGRSFNIPLSGMQQPQGGVRSYYLDEIAKTKASVDKLTTEPCLVFPMIADIHYKSKSDFPELIDVTVENMLALSKEMRFDFFVSLGDIIEGVVPQDSTEKEVDYLYKQFARLDVPFYPVIGNHDENWKHGAFTAAQLHSIYMRNTYDVCFDMTSMCGTNYYKDFYSLGVRLIFLNSLNGGTFGYSEDTCAWFEEALDTPHDVYVFTHVSPVRSHQYNYWGHFNDEKITASILKAPNFKMLFNGHSHFDCEFTAPFNNKGGRTDNPFLAYSLTCNEWYTNNARGDDWPAHAVKPERKKGTVTEDAFDIVVIRPKSQKVNTVRFGAGVDREFDLVTGESVGESAAEKFPKEMTVTLDFAKEWPFEEACAVSGEQRAGGEYYNCYHEYTRTDGVKGKLGMRFGIQRSSATSGQNYSYADGCLKFGETSGDGTGGTYGMISVPGIPGRYVKSIEITHNKNALFTLADGERFVYGASPNASSSTTAGPTVFNLPYVRGEKTVPAKLGAPYNVRLRTAEVGISKIKITYSTTEPK